MLWPIDSLYIKVFIFKHLCFGPPGVAAVRRTGRGRFLRGSASDEPRCQVRGKEAREISASVPVGSEF